MSTKNGNATPTDGFIGSHLVETLVRQGRKVRAFVLYNSFNSWGWLDHCEPDVKGQFEVFAGDIRDPHGVKTVPARFVPITEEHPLQGQTPYLP
ncbi:MAG: GDP-mannose 4,6-dehydratase [Desulfurivibrio sp.]|nr:GDP-mannose 4,6-dehydratase [Desulfurivibrio sp.]